MWGGGGANSYELCREYFNIPVILGITYRQHDFQNKTWDFVIKYTNHFSQTYKHIHTNQTKTKNISDTNQTKTKNISEIMINTLNF